MPTFWSFLIADFSEYLLMSIWLVLALVFLEKPFVLPHTYILPSLTKPVFNDHVFLS